MIPIMRSPRMVVSTVLSGWHCCLTSSVTAIQMPINTVNEVHNSLVVSDKMVASRTLGPSRFHSGTAIAIIQSFALMQINVRLPTREKKKTENKITAVICERSYITFVDIKCVGNNEKQGVFKGVMKTKIHHLHYCGD